VVLSDKPNGRSFKMNIIFATSSIHSAVCVNGKTYVRSKYAEGDIRYFVICKNGAYRRLNTPVIKAKIDVAIIELAEIEAYREDEILSWAVITPELIQLHDKRVIFGIDLMTKHNVDDVLTACHMEAMEMEHSFAATRVDLELRMKSSTAAIVSEYNTPTVTVEVGNTDRFGSEQIEIRYVADGRLAWRAWDYEPDFESGLHTELAYHNIP
jgi:hypothetical protein